MIHVQQVFIAALFTIGSAVALSGCSSTPKSNAIAQAQPPEPLTIAASEPPAEPDVAPKTADMIPPSPAVPETEMVAVPKEEPVPKPAPPRIAKETPPAEAETAEPVREAAVIEKTVVEEAAPKSETETVIVETEDAIVERVEKTTERETDIDKVTIDPETGLAVVEEEVVENRETIVETTMVDKRTGRVNSTVDRKETETIELKKPRVGILVPRSRQFAAGDLHTAASRPGLAMIAFPRSALSADPQRVGRFCIAYLGAVETELRRPSPASPPVVSTIWPVSSPIEPAGLSEIEICEQAVATYNRNAANRAIRDAEMTGFTLNGRGPFLLAWSPADARGQPGSLVLATDLSGLDEVEDVYKVLLAWQHDVEHNPRIWASDGWNPQGLREVLQHWEELFGPRSLVVLGPSEG